MGCRSPIREGQRGCLGHSKALTIHCHFHCKRDHSIANNVMQQKGSSVFQANANRNLENSEHRWCRLSAGSGVMGVYCVGEVWYLWLPCCNCGLVVKAKIAFVLPKKKFQLYNWACPSLSTRNAECCNFLLLNFFLSALKCMQFLFVIFACHVIVGGVHCNWTGLHACCCCWSKGVVYTSQELRWKRLSISSGAKAPIASDIVEANHGKQLHCYWLIV